MLLSSYVVLMLTQVQSNVALMEEVQPSRCRAKC